MMPGNRRRAFGIDAAVSATCCRKRRCRRSGEPAPSPTASSNDDDHFEVPEMAVVKEPSNNGVFDQPSWIYFKGGARVEADSATQSSAGVWYKRGSMSIFLEAARVDRIEVEDAEVGAQSGKKASGWSTGRGGPDNLIRQNGYKYNVDPYLIFL